jgi:hypothetical protein
MKFARARLAAQIHDAGEVAVRLDHDVCAFPAKRSKDSECSSRRRDERFT